MPVIEHYEKLGKVAQVSSKFCGCPFYQHTGHGRWIALLRWMRSTLQLSLSWLRSLLRYQLQLGNISFNV